MFSVKICSEVKCKRFVNLKKLIVCIKEVRRWLNAIFATRVYVPGIGLVLLEARFHGVLTELGSPMLRKSKSSKTEL